MKRFWKGLRISYTNDRNYSTSSHQELLISLLQSCERSIQTAQIHASMHKTGIDKVPFPLSKLLAHLSIQDIQYAASIFQHIKSPNLYMFNTMLRGYSISNHPEKGLVLFNFLRARSPRKDFLSDQFTFISVIKSCSRLLDVWTGIGVHSIVLLSGFDLFLNVQNGLLHFYCVCGKIQDAHQVFDELGERKDLVSWNSLIGGYLCMNKYDFVVDLFKDLCRNGVGVSVTTVVSVLSGLEETRYVHLGECVHVFCIKLGFLSSLNVATALIYMYGKLGCIHSCGRIFDEVEMKRDVVMWNCLIDGYAKSGYLEEALEQLRLMKHDGVQPNSLTLAGLLSSCSSSPGALAIGQCVHKYVEEQGMQLDVILGTAIVDMYAKSGMLVKAINVFERMKCKDVRCWTATISGYGLHGEVNHAITLFRRMEEEVFEPNEVTFLAVLNACSHGGLVSEGIRCFRRMVEVYGLVPRIEHYGCVIDLLGRAGLLDEAYELIKGLPVEKDATAWRALLGACRLYGNVDLAVRVKRELEQIEGEHPADTLVLRSVYAAVGMLPDCGLMLEKEKQLMKAQQLSSEKVVKEAGWSTIEHA